MSEIVSKNLNLSEKSWTFLGGSKRTAVELNSFFVGLGSYLPGWKWSEHVGKKAGKSSETHTGYIISGQMVIKGADGKEVTVGPSDAFEVTPGHDAWVAGTGSCVAFDFGHKENSV